MRGYRLYGYALIVGSLLLVIMGLTHPTGAGLLDSQASLGHVARINHFAHGSAIAGMWLTCVGLLGLSRLLSAEGPAAAIALLGFALVTAVGLVAPTIDGFVVPELASRWLAADELTRAVMKQLIMYCVLIASSLTRVYLTLGSVALLLYSYAIRRAKVSRGLPWLGVFVTLVAVASVAGGSPMVSVHELLLLVVGQAAWMSWAGLILLGAVRRDESDPA